MMTQCALGLFANRPTKLEISQKKLEALTNDKEEIQRDNDNARNFGHIGFEEDVVGTTDSTKTPLVCF